MKEKTIEKIKRGMEERHVSQSELAEKAHTTRAVINNVLKRRRPGNAELLVAIAKALEIPEAELLMDEGLLPDKKQARREAKEDQFLEVFNQLSEDVQDVALENLKALSRLSKKNASKRHKKVEAVA